MLKSCRTEYAARPRAASPENPSTNLANPSEWLIDWLGGQSEAGIAVNEKSAMRFSAVFRCVAILSATVASLPIRVYRRTQDAQGRTDREREDAHPVRALLRVQPNSVMASFTFWELVMVWLLQRGNGYAEIVRSQGRPVALEHIPPHCVVMIRRNDLGGLTYVVQEDTGVR